MCMYAYVQKIILRHILVWYAAIAQLGERQTEDLKVPGSIPGLGIFSNLFSLILFRNFFFTIDIE